MSKFYEKYLQANAFSKSADILIDIVHKDAIKAEDLLLSRPAIVNCAFACELYLKALLTGNKIGRIHDLEKLWKKLPIDLRERIDNKIKNKYGKIENAFGIPHIKQIAKAFNDWRYCYEKDGSLIIDEWFLFEFRDRLKDECERVLQEKGNI